MGEFEQYCLDVGCEIPPNPGINLQIKNAIAKSKLQSMPVQEAMSELPNLISEYKLLTDDLKERQKNFLREYHNFILANILKNYDADNPETARLLKIWGELYSSVP
jgi:hypothetical protein